MERTRDELEKQLENPNVTPMSLPLEFLKAITRDFSIDSVIGEGGYGVVYKGVLQSGKIIAVKKLFEIRLKEETFQNEVRYLMGIRHPNVVQFVGYCAESRWEAIEMPSGSGRHIFAEIPKRLLCFEYVSNKSLDTHISDESLGLEWNMRYEIIKGICNGLHFLHEECHIVHLDLKPENILMDSTMSPKIADFGLSRIFGEQQSRIVTDNRVGTCGYMAPEYLTQGVVSNKADIFSLGVIVIELITGHRDYPYCYQDSADNTATPIQQFIENVLARWRDKFVSTPNYKKVESSTQQVRVCISIALQCVDPAMEKRPSAKDIIKMLNGVDKMEAKNELQSDTLCKDQLLVLNPTEDLSPPPLSESSRANGIASLSLKPSCNPQAASDTTSEHLQSVQQAIPPFIEITCQQRMLSLDVSQIKPWIITGHDNGYIDIFDYETQKSIGSDTGNGHEARIIKFIERKQWFIVGSFDGYITVYTYQTKVQKITSFRAKGRFLPAIYALAVHPTQPYVLSACNGHIQLWDWDKNWQCIKTFQRPSFVANQYELAFNPNNTNEFASADTMDVKIWNLGSVKHNYTLYGHMTLVKSLNFFTTQDDNQEYLISGSEDNTAKIWDLQKRACVHTLEGFMSPVIFASSYPSLPVLITCTKDGAINLWSATNFRLMRTLNVGGPGRAYSRACLTGSGRVVMGNESTLFMVDIRDEEPSDSLVGNEEPLDSLVGNDESVTSLT